VLVCCREDVKNAIVGDSALNAKATLMSIIVIPFDVQYLKMPMISRFEGCSKRSGKKAPWITIKVSWKEKNTDAFRRHDIFIICPYVGNFQIHEQQCFSPRVWHSVSIVRLRSQRRLASSSACLSSQWQWMAVAPIMFWSEGMYTLGSGVH
jgi:hypothetical protein